MPRHRATGMLLPALLCTAIGTVGLASLDFQRLQQRARVLYQGAAEDPVRDWIQLLNSTRSLDTVAQLRRTNQFFNSRLQFHEDRDIWGEEDYWATPLEAMAKGRGDCEDFSIAKYVTLLELGIPADKLRLIYVRAQVAGRSQAHMVLGYFPSPATDPLVLDNINGEVLPGSLRPDLTPVFSFNDGGLWAGGKLATRDPTAKLSRWRKLLLRLQQDGFR